MAVLINLKEPTLGAIRKVNLGVAEVVEAVVIIEETKLPITVDQLVVPIASTPPISVTTARITASDVARWAT